MYELQKVGVLIRIVERYRPARSPTVFASMGFG